MSTRKSVPAKTHTLKQQKPSRKRLIMKILLLILLLGAGYLLVEFLLLPSGNEFKTKNPATTAFMDIRIDQAADDGRKLEIKQQWVAIEKISRNLIRAVLAGEDARFFKHNGFDTEAIQKAIEKDWKERRFLRGASTISQQLAKNLYLSESKNPLRKVKEALITNRLENHLNKKRILEIYLNVIEWGDGIFGAEAAARNYFSKSAAQLSVDEAAFLAAMIPNPRTVYNPKKNPKAVARRQRVIIRGMRVISLPKDF